jgi:hypothetical protein
MIVSLKVLQFFFEKDAHWPNKSKRKKEKKIFPRNKNELISCPIFVLRPLTLSIITSLSKQEVNVSKFGGLEKPIWHSG